MQGGAWRCVRSSPTCRPPSRRCANCSLLCLPPSAGWSLALWAELNHPLSALTLAVGAGIFCQGVGAYSFAPVFQARGRLAMCRAFG